LGGSDGSVDIEPEGNECRWMNLGPSGFDPDPDDIPNPIEVDELVPVALVSRLGAGEEVPGRVPASSDTILA